MIEIIPAIDVVDGECVRLTQGDYGRKTLYAKDPLEIAKRFEDSGLRWLHMVDLDGAKSSRPVNLRVLEKIATRTSLRIEFGGGIKSEDSLRSVLDSGANRAICGSIAVSEPQRFSEWLSRYGGDAVVLGADVRDGVVAVNGWLKDSTITAEALIDEFIPCGLRYVICTDISKDGMLEGPSFEMYERLQGVYQDVDVIVSGGISSMDDILRLDRMGMRSVIVGKALYEGLVNLDDISKMIDS